MVRDTLPTKKSITQQKFEKKWGAVAQFGCMGNFPTALPPRSTPRCCLFVIFTFGVSLPQQQPWLRKRTWASSFRFDSPWLFMQVLRVL